MPKLKSHSGAKKIPSGQRAQGNCGLCWADNMFGSDCREWSRPQGWQ